MESEQLSAGCTECNEHVSNIPMDSVSHFVSRIFVRRSSKKHQRRSAGAAAGATPSAAAAPLPPSPRQPNNAATNATSSEQNPIAEPTTTTNTTTATVDNQQPQPQPLRTTFSTPESFESDESPASPRTENSVNVDTLEFDASRDLVSFLDSGWSSSVKKQNEAKPQLAFPAFEYLLHEPQQPKQSEELQRPATSSGMRNSRQLFGTLSKKPINLSLNKPKSAVNLIKRIRSTPNFKEQQRQQQQQEQQQQQQQA
ncbi:hypothetical protein BDB00DRAFT_291636 [Zychaea mexicana]|uniref:uncharacterized protein n=1 Tax=Zychaea mexicana TaxID=64656 RepID=UPI0022FE3BBF|nr:uncharacterized protein BDB00DRAFT_291636 [Zychaea mexicana]KAI9494811.1 hypothetical protein BDB00DRAFT_291636 [Zychaea mexicana]